jgi:hypothetical protein
MSKMIIKDLKGSNITLKCQDHRSDRTYKLEKSREEGEVVELGAPLKIRIKAKCRKYIKHKLPIYFRK